MLGFHSMSRDLWSLIFHILEMLWLNPSIPFGGYKLSHIQALKTFNTIEDWEKRYSGEISPQLSMHPFVLEILNLLCSTPKLFLSCDGEPHWLLHVSLPLWRIEVVEAQLEGLGFLVMVCVVTEVCHLCTYVDYINRNTFFSSNWYLENIWITFHVIIFHIC